MKSFKEYLTESKKVYEFKIKIAGDLPTDGYDKLKNSLAAFSVESCSKGKSTPIQETQVDFPDHKNVGVTVFDVALAYPATSSQVQAMVQDALSESDCCVKVRNELEDAEVSLNHEHDDAEGEVLLGKDYEKSNNQGLVGEKHMMSFLKGLTKDKKALEQVKGVNEKLLAKKAPSDKSGVVKTVKTTGGVSPVGSKQNTIPSPVKGK